MGELIMRRVFIVVGHSGSRKSSTIRALTGVGHPKVLQVQPINGEILDIYIHPASLQEDKRTPDDFIRFVENLNDNPDVLVALRLQGSRTGEFPDATEYALQFEQAGWQIAGVASLHGGPRNPLINNTPAPIPIDNSNNMPANGIANRIRREWDWL